MSTRTRRQRNSNAASSPPEATRATAELQTLIHNLSQAKRTSPDHVYPDLDKVIHHVQAIQKYLENAPKNSRAKDDFRHLSGFQTLLDTLRTYSGFYHPTQREQTEKVQLFDLLESILGALSQTFQQHYGNRRYFQHRVEGGGWPALEQAIASIGIGGSLSEVWSEAQLFGKLLSFALGDKRLDTFCQDAVLVQPPEPKVKDSVKPRQEESTNAAQKDTSKDDPASGAANQKIVHMVDKTIEEIIGRSSFFHNVDSISTIIDFWKTTPRTPTRFIHAATLIVISTVLKVSRASTHNLLELHATGILSALLPLSFGDDSMLPAIERQRVQDLCCELLSLGFNTLEDAQSLFRNESNVTFDFLSKMMGKSSTPSYVQFDLSLHGYTSIELPSLARSFPPPSTQLGYTFAAWVRIDRFDSSSHTTLFGAFDSTQTCFVLAYLEKDTHNFILQTSVTSSRPSVRFKTTSFKENHWYHIAIVHRRPRTLISSKAILYVDGEMVEQVKCQYPEPPPLSNGSTESFASFTSSGSKQNPVQAFVGTPQDLSARLGRGVVSSCWSLASAHLFDDVLSDDLIAVYHRLGPRYNGNFQDCLGSFQTYEASAALGMRNEMMHPGKDETSDITNAIRGKAGLLVAESRMLLSILPTAILADENQHKGSESQLIRGLSRMASTNLYQLTHNTGTSLAINAAVPSINEALTRTYGTSVLAGDPVVVDPQSLDDAMWRLGGFAAIALKMIEQASSPDRVIRAVGILFESVKGSWRNSEAMERENGYAILGALLRGKIGAGVVIASNNDVVDAQVIPRDEREKLGFQLLSLVLDFVGYNHARPEDSFIINPLAYRILLVDFDMWRKTSLLTQKLYFRQFITFGVNSKHHNFNSRRLLRMRKSNSLAEMTLVLMASRNCEEIYRCFKSRSLLSRRLSVLHGSS